jgi:hypothetical protein
MYDVGEPRQLTSHWYDSDGEDANPSTIVLTVTHPSGAVDTYNKVDLTQGDTTADWFRWVTPDASGAWRYNFVGTVDGFDVEQGGVFLVGEGSSTSPTGPCEPWATWDDALACGPSSLSEANAQQREYAVDVVSEIMFNLSGRVYPGICSITRSLCFTCLCCHPNRCGCDPANGIDLGIATPVWGAWDVIVDGVTLDPSAYRVHDRRWLVRTDEETWPMGGSQTELLDPNNFRVTWAYGRPIPIGGKRAASLFLVEVAKMCLGDKTCQIPQRVTSISREGVSYTILDSMTMIKEGRTGIALVDLWLTADKRGRKARPGMFSAMAAGSNVTKIA